MSVSILTTLSSSEKFSFFRSLNGFISTISVCLRSVIGQRSGSVSEDRSSTERLKDQRSKVKPVGGTMRLRKKLFFFISCLFTSVRFVSVFLSSWITCTACNNKNNLPTNQSINQLTNPSTNQSTYQDINLTIHLSTEQPTN